MSATTSSWMDDKRMEAVEKVVLQRAKISRISRQLKNRLALASFKAKRGWENLDLASIEPKVAEEVAARRQSVSSTALEHSISVPAPSQHHYTDQRHASDSFLPPPPLPPAVNRHSRTPSASKKHQRPAAFPASAPRAGQRKRARTVSHDSKKLLPSNYAFAAPWTPAGQENDEGVYHGMLDDESRDGYSPINMRLSQSSPVYPGVVSQQAAPSVYYQNVYPPQQATLPQPVSASQMYKLPNGSPSKTRPRTHLDANQANRHRRNKSSQASVQSTGSTASTVSVATSNPSPSLHHKFAAPPAPPRTPPARRPAGSGFPSSLLPKTGEEGADLLMFLATSPSPAQRSSFATTPVHHHQPPTSQQPPPSIMANTPPSRDRPFGTPLAGNGPQTPSQGFNFSDYVNNIFTPSPAQVQWHSRTPTITPARRRLNFDHLGDDSSSLNRQSGDAQGSAKSVSVYGGMEVGGSLVP